MRDLMREHALRLEVERFAVKEKFEPVRERLGAGQSLRGARVERLPERLVVEHEHMALPFFLVDADSERLFHPSVIGLGVHEHGLGFFRVVEMVDKVLGLGVLPGVAVDGQRLAAGFREFSIGKLVPADRRYAGIRAE